MTKKIYIQFFLIISFVAISLLIFFKYFNNSITKNTSKVNLENTTNSGESLIEDLKYLSTDKEGNKYKTLYLHSISVAEEFRGQGLCKQITDEFVKKFGKNHILYLTVRTESGNENVSGIKCYEKNGFIMLPQVYRDHYDGKNNAMIRLPTNSKNSIRSRRRRKKSRNKRK